MSVVPQGVSQAWNTEVILEASLHPPLTCNQSSYLKLICSMSKILILMSEVIVTVPELV